LPLTWPEFGSLHPFAPREQADLAMALPTRRMIARDREQADIRCAPNSAERDRIIAGDVAQPFFQRAEPSA